MQGVEEGARLTVSVTVMSRLHILALCVYSKRAWIVFVHWMRVYVPVVCACACVCVHVRACVCVCMCVCVCVCVHDTSPSHAPVYMCAGPTIDSYKDSVTKHLCHCRQAVGDVG